MRSTAPSHTGARGDKLRRRIAVEAARLMSEQGIRDFHLAKRKAAEHLNVRDEANLPRNNEIELALREHQRLFLATQQPQHLRYLREAAVAAMQFFKRFEARLFGAVLDGSADRHSAVCLHLFCDTPEQVIQLLDEHGIAYREQDRRQRLQHNEYAQAPGLCIQVNGVAFELTVLAYDAMRQAPLDRVNARPMQRATLAQVEQLLASDEVRDTRQEKNSPDA